MFHMTATLSEVRERGWLLFIKAISSNLQKPAFYPCFMESTPDSHSSNEQERHKN